MNKRQLYFYTGPENPSTYRQNPNTVVGIMNQITKTALTEEFLQRLLSGLLVILSRLLVILSRLLVILALVAALCFVAAFCLLSLLLLRKLLRGLQQVENVTATVAESLGLGW